MTTFKNYLESVESDKGVRVLESQEVAEDKLYREYDMDHMFPVKDDYVINIMHHQDDDNSYATYDLYQKVVDTEDKMTPAYKHVAMLDSLPSRNATKEQLVAAAEKEIASGQAQDISPMAESLSQILRLAGINKE